MTPALLTQRDALLVRLDVLAAMPQIRVGRHNHASLVHAAMQRLARVERKLQYYTAAMSPKDALRFEVAHQEVSNG